LDERVARRRGSRLALALAVLSAWRRLPWRQRQAVLRLTRRHGLRIALALLAARRRRRLR
jgi:hypothetical protein